MSSEELSSLHDVYAELDNDEGAQKASYVLQFLWRDLTSDHDVIGPHFTLSGSIESSHLYSMVTRTMLAFHTVNFKVRALVCDGASSNLSLLKVLCGFQAEDSDSVSAAPTTPWFVSPYDGDKVYLIICPSHQVSYKPHQI